MSSNNTVYLITGANRGLGLGMVTALLQRPSTTIIAGVRDVTSSSSQALLSLHATAGSKVVLAHIDSNDHSSAELAVKGLKDIDKIDTVIANAGITGQYVPAADLSPDVIRDCFEVNAIAPLVLFQASRALLLKSTKPMFVGVSTISATISAMEHIPVPVAAYGASKAALNSIVRRLHFENADITSFVLHPGWVQTDMGNGGARAFGMKEAPMSLETSIKGVLEIVDNATREKTSGTFQSADPEVPCAW